MKSNWNSHPSLMGMQNVTPTLESSMSVSYEIKHTFSIGQSSGVPGYLSQDIYPRDNSDYRKIYK